MLIEILVLLAAIPSGFLIAYFSSDELIQGRPWFKALITLSILSIIYSYIKAAHYISYTSAFIFIIALISLYKSHDKKWTRKRT